MFDDDIPTMRYPYAGYADMFDAKRHAQDALISIDRVIAHVADGYGIPDELDSVLDQLHRATLILSDMLYEQEKNK